MKQLLSDLAAIIEKAGTQMDEEAAGLDRDAMLDVLGGLIQQRIGAERQALSAAREPARLKYFAAIAPDVSGG